MSILPAVENDSLLPGVSSSENELAVQHPNQLCDDNDQPEESKFLKDEHHLQVSTTALVEKGKEAKVCL